LKHFWIEEPPGPIIRSESDSKNSSFRVSQKILQGTYGLNEGTGKDPTVSGGYLIFL
jgi:hypothetical protein